MKTIDVNLPVRENPIYLTFQSANKFIVLIPEMEFDISWMARKIWELAAAMKCDVLLLGLCNTKQNESSLRRKLATLSALVESNAISVDVRLGTPRDWLQTLREAQKDGDVIAYFSNKDWDFIGHVLETEFNSMVYVFTGIAPAEDYVRPSWISNVITWLGFLGIVLSFFWLQMKISQLSYSGTSQILFCVSALLELGSLWVWNNLFSQAGFYD